MSLSDRIALAGLAVAAFGILLSVFAAHFHSVVRNDAARASLIERLSTVRVRDWYHARLADGLNWLDDRIGQPPFARHERRGGWSWGLGSLGICIAVALVYSFGFYLAGWVAGTPGAFGQVTLMDVHWAPPWGDWLPRLLVALAVIGAWLLGVWCFWGIGPWSERAADRLEDSLSRYTRPLAVVGRSVFQLVTAGIILAGVLAVVIFTGRGIGAGAFAGAAAVVMAVAVPQGPARAVAWLWVAVFAGYAVVLVLLGEGTEQKVAALLFWLALPYLNGLLDWISLSASRWFGRGIIAKRNAPMAFGITVGLAVLDLIAAVAFLFAAAWLLAFGGELTGVVLGLALDLERYIEEAAAAPWTVGFWATFMVLSTLIPTALHFALALGAMLMAWEANPLRVWAARQLATGNEANYLLPQLYLTCGWTVPGLVAPVLLICLVAQLVGLFEPLPDALRDTALSAIDTARAVAQ